MKKIITLFAIIGLVAFSSCEGPEGPIGPPGFDGLDGQNVNKVFEIKNRDFAYNKDNGFTIYEKFNPFIGDASTVLIYRLVDVIDPTTPIWQLIPRTLYPSQGELDYDYDFSREDFTIYAGGTYDLNLTPNLIKNQTFRIVIVPGSFTKKSVNKEDYSDYNAVIKKYNIDDSNVKQLK